MRKAQPNLSLRPGPSAHTGARQVEFGVHIPPPVSAAQVTATHNGSAVDCLLLLLVLCHRRLQGLSIWIAHLETPAGTLASPFGNYTAVLPLGIAPLLPQLAPVVILPVLLAAAATRIRLPPVLLTAASAGTGASCCCSCWVLHAWVCWHAYGLQQAVTDGSGRPLHLWRVVLQAS